MRVEYADINNCYTVGIRVRVGKSWRYVDAVIDTGATNTAIAVDVLVGSVDECEVGKVTSSLDSYAQKFGINRVTIHGATKESGIVSTYAYDASFDNVIVGGHFMRQFHARIMINGAKGVCVIGNDFLNMCKYYHNAGEHQLTVENPVEQRYYESFSGKRVLHNSQLGILLSGNSVDGRMSEEDPIATDMLRRGEEILKKKITKERKRGSKPTVQINRQRRLRKKESERGQKKL